MCVLDVVIFLLDFAVAAVVFAGVVVRLLKLIDEITDKRRGWMAMDLTSRGPAGTSATKLGMDHHIPKPDTERPSPTLPPRDRIRESGHSGVLVSECVAEWQQPPSLLSEAAPLRLGGAAPRRSR